MKKIQKQNFLIPIDNQKPKHIQTNEYNCHIKDNYYDSRSINTSQIVKKK